MADETLTWIDPGSTSYAWDGSGVYRALDGRQGFFAPPTSIIEQETPQQAGSSLRFVKTTSRPLKVMLLVKVADESTFENTRHTLTQALNPNRGVGTLRVNGANGSQRDISAFCEAGREGDEAYPSRFMGGYIFPLSFRALDPYWHDTSFTSVSKASFPVTFSQSNGGDVNTYPVWTITGPCTAVTITNNTTGKSLALTATLASSAQTITVDTRPRQQSSAGGTVVREDGSSHFSYLSATSSFFPLIVGSNSLTYTVTGSGAGTAVQLQYKQLYEGC